MENKNFFKNTKINKSVYITAVTLLLALAIVVIMVAATNRAKRKNNELPAETTDEVTDNTPATTVPTTPSDNPDDGEEQDVSGKVPVFSLPASGTLAKGHDASIQVFSNTMSDYRVHLGIDINTEENAPVYASADGIVSQIWEDPLMGQCIAIKHDGDAYSIYKNLNTTIPDNISEGASVKAGDLIGAVGASAMIEIADEPHLHFEITVGGIQVDPRDYLDESELVSLSVDTVYEG